MNGSDNNPGPGSPAGSAAAIVREPGLEVRPGFLRTLSGHWRMTWVGGLRGAKLAKLVVQLLVLPVFVFLTVPQGNDFAYAMWMLNTYLFLAVPVACLAAGGALIRDEVQDDTLGFFLTRPTTRARLYLAKYLCGLARLELLLSLEVILLVGVGLVRGVDGVLSFGILLLGTQALAVPGWTALSGLLGLITRKYVVLGILYGAVVEVGFGLIPTNINNLSLFHHAKVLLRGDALVARVDRVAAAPGDSAILSLAVLSSAPLVFLVIGMIVFTWREYHFSDEMQK